MKEYDYQQAIESSNIVSKTDINGIITFVNDEFCRISGYTKEELIGVNHNIVRHPDIPAKTFENLWRIILAKKVYKATVKNLAKDGSTFYVNTTVMPVLDKNGEIKEFIAIRYDVTDTVKLTESLREKEEELKELNATLEDRVKVQTIQLRDLNRNLEKRVNEEVAKNLEKERILYQQARLASMGEMIGNIAHQWRQPLSELSIYLYRLKKLHNENDDNFSDIYESSKNVIKKMSQTIDDFRNFFDPNKPKESFDIAEAVKESIDMMKGSLARDDIKVSITSQDKTYMYGYKSELIQVVINILNNAKDSLNEHLKAEKKININISRYDAKVASITIRDNGGGIKEDIRERIFEPYFTTKPGVLGTGLGLYMSKMIIEKSMSGKIEAINTENGACFSIKVPMVIE